MNQKFLWNKEIAFLLLNLSQCALYTLEEKFAMEMNLWHFIMLSGKNADIYIYKEEIVLFLQYVAARARPLG